MPDSFTECAIWMQTFLQSQIVLRSSIAQQVDAYQVHLLSLSTNGRLLCFTYSSRNCPSTDVFAMTPTPGPNLASQIHNMISYWQGHKLDFWASTLQAEVFEYHEGRMAPVTACCLEMQFAYHRVLACLETHPLMSETQIDDVVLAHKRLKGFLDEQYHKSAGALASLRRLCP